jgi:CPA2 family monovalent cation:H+ antiporter-2
VGRHVAEVLGRLSVPRLVIEVDPKRLDRLRELGVPVLYGDAANSEILRHAALERARVLIVTVSDEIAGRMIVESARRWAPTLHIVVRASTCAGAHQLSDAGANAVIWPELEGGVEFVGRTLQGLGFPSSEIQRQTDAARRQGLNRPANSG